jgi:cell division inhibitor SepF
MPGFMKKTAVYLGLMEGDDPYAYEDFDEEPHEDVRPLRADDDRADEQGPARFTGGGRAESAAEGEARPLLLSEPRRPRDAEPTHYDTRRATPRESADRRDTGEFARPAPVAVLPDRYERVMAVSGSIGLANGSAPVEAYRITTLHPRTYNEARTIGEHFRDGTPVIMNLTEMGDADAKRLVDFAAGLVFGLGGTIERVTQKVFLLSPANVDVTAEDKARIAEGGFFNQS